MSVITDCTECSLCKTRTNVVVSRGQGHAIMFLGEAPGKDEDLQGMPFVGRSGKLLDKAIAVAGINDYIITNVVKCRPPNNRKPFPDEVLACSRWLESQLDELQPTLIVCLGATALNYFKPGVNVSKEVEDTSLYGWYSTAKGRNIATVYHPAYVLRGGLPVNDYYNLFRNVRSASIYLGAKDLISRANFGSRKEN